MWIQKHRLQEEAGNEGDKGGGGGGESWRDSLPDDLKTVEELGNFETVGDLAKDWQDLKSYRGSSIRIPGEDAGQEQLQEFHEKLLSKVPGVMIRPDLNDPDKNKEFFRSLGVPDNEDGYEIPKFDDIEADLSNEETVNALKKTALEAGLTPDQFKKVIHDIAKNNESYLTSAEESRRDGLIKLTNEWGAAFERNKMIAKDVAVKTGAPPELLQAIDTDRAGPDTMKWLFSVAKSLGPEKMQMLDKQGEPGVMTPSEAKAKISEIMGNREHPYWVAGHPDHAAAIKKMVELQGLANPGASSDINSLRASGVGFGT